jgi:RecA-family ATPase
MTKVKELDLYLKAFEKITSRVRTNVTAIKKNNKSVWTKSPLTNERLAKHISGGLPRGVCPIKEGESTIRLALLDLDSHKGETSWGEMVNVANKIIVMLNKYGIQTIPFCSSGGQGIHLIMIWDLPQDAYSVRMYLTGILRECGYENGTKGLAQNQIEIFPKQNKIEVGRYGNQFILPLARKSLPLDSETLDIREREHFLQIDWKISEPVPFREMLIREVKRVSEPKPDEDKIRAITEMLLHVSSEDRDTWLRGGMAVHYEFAGSKIGLDIFDNWSKKATSYKDRKDIEYTWNSFKNNAENPVTIGTLIKMAREGGWTECFFDMFDDFASESDTKKGRFTLIQANTFAKQTSVKWVIKNVLPEVGLAMVYGESGCGKTFFILDTCLAIARGINWNGHVIKAAHKVVYIAAEGVLGISTRMKAYAEFNGVKLSDLPFYIITDSLNLQTNDDKPLIESILAQGGADVVVIDTLAQVTPGANENSGEHMGAVLKRCQNLMVQLDCLVILIHHSGKDTNRGSRGWSGIKAAMDTEIKITAKAGESVATISKQKDGESGKTFAFNLESVSLDDDEDGDAITSCVVKYLYQETQSIPKPSGKWQKYLLDAVKSEILFDLDDLIDKDVLIMKAMKLYSTSAHKNEKLPRKDVVSKGLDSLIKRGLLISDKNCVQLSQKSLFS